jgi:pimeloyl-ACP methyl ester carboxylesterase
MIYSPRTASDIHREFGIDNPLKFVCDKLLHVSQMKKETLIGPTEITVQCNDDGSISIPGFICSSRENPSEIRIKVLKQDETSDCGGPPLSPTLTPVSSALSLSSLSLHDPAILEDPPVRLSIEHWRAVNKAPAQEAVIFVHGYNSPLKSAVERFGQLVTLGDLPAHIKPIVFNWPGGNIFSYFKALELVQQEQVQNDLNALIRLLGEAGVKHIHILAHSMGARLVLNCVKTWSGVFKLRGIQAADDPTNNVDGRILPHLASLTLLNPEAELTEFIRSQYPALRTYTNLVTIYGNDRDIALRSCELLASKDYILGCNVQKLYTTHDVPSNDDEEHVSLHDLSRENGPTPSKCGIFHCPPGVSHERDDYVSTIATSQRQWCDLDVVDTTWLEVNVHATRHSYFNINKLVVDDIMDLIVHRRRAKNRGHRLLCIEGNVFSFLSAPPYVVN